MSTSTPKPSPILPIIDMEPNTSANRAFRAVSLAGILHSHLVIEAPERFLPVMAVIDHLLTIALESLGELDGPDEAETGFSAAYPDAFHAVCRQLDLPFPLVDSLQPGANMAPVPTSDSSPG
jgi:hypothetical protein